MAITAFTGKFGFLSNFSPAQVRLDGDLYRSVEHAYQAAKSVDPLHRRRCQRAPTPGIAKRYGRQCRLRLDWDTVKVAIMRDLLRQKFDNTGLVGIGWALLQTGDEELVEGNYWGDRFWGVCQGVGENHLGKLLMEIRTELRLREAAENLRG